MLVFGNALIWLSVMRMADAWLIQRHLLRVREGATLFLFLAVIDMRTTTVLTVVVVVGLVVSFVPLARANVAMQE